MCASFNAPTNTGTLLDNRVDSCPLFSGLVSVLLLHSVLMSNESTTAHVGITHQRQTKLNAKRLLFPQMKRSMDDYYKQQHEEWEEKPGGEVKPAKGDTFMTDATAVQLCSIVCWRRSSTKPGKRHDRELESRDREAPVHPTSLISVPSCMLGSFVHLLLSS